MNPERERFINIDNLRVTKRQWVVAMAESALELFKTENAEPDEENLWNFFDLLTNDGRARITDLAKAKIENEYNEILFRAQSSGFDQKSAKTLTRKILRERYKKIEDNDERNFRFLDPLIFRERN